MVRQHEDNMTHEMCDLLDLMNSTWSVQSQQLGLFADTSAHPDLWIETLGASNVAIENEVEPHKPDKDAEDKRGLMVKNGMPPAVIGIQIPKRFRNIGRTAIKTELAAANDFKYVVYGTERFPETSYLVGSLADISSVVRMISVPTEKIADCVMRLKRSIDDVANQISKSGVDAKNNIALEIRQPANSQTWKISGLIISNALVFHSMLAGTMGVPTLEKLKGIDRKISGNDLSVAWKVILKKNYYAIFEIAKKILAELNPPEAADIITELAITAEYIHQQRLTNSTDMYGTLIQKVISDRDTLKAYYTRSESAVLLASMAVPHADDLIYKNDAKKFILADFACGTGTLLAAAYRIFGTNYETQGGTLKDIHTHMVENNIVGYDVLPSAAHLTASCIASILPQETFEMSRIGKIDFGKFESIKNKDKKTKAVYRLGSLDLIDSDSTFDRNITLIGGQSEERHFNAEINPTSCDLVIMNPPFTSNTKSDDDWLAMYASFGISREDQKKMKELEDAKFKKTCKDGRAGSSTYFMAIADRKVKNGGNIAFVIPSTVANGIGYARVRNMLIERYESIILVSISGSSGGDRSFSADTSIGEALLVARKCTKSLIEKITYINARINRNTNQLRNANLMIRKMNSGLITKNPKKPKRGIKKDIYYYVDLKQKAEERLVIAQAEYQKYVKNRRAMFVVLEKRPDTQLASLIIGNAITRLDNVKRIEGQSLGGTPIILGGKIVGYALDASISSPWLFVNVQEPMLSQCAYRLANGELFLPESLASYEIPMTMLGNVLGSLTREIQDYFYLLPIAQSPLHYVLDRIDSNSQKTMLVKPNQMAIEKQVGVKEFAKMQKLLKEKSRVHLNLECRFTSQQMIVMYTKEKALGGTQVPTIDVEEKYEKVLTVWSNSTLGILCFWAHVPKQQLGRSKATKSGMIDMPILDFTKLSTKQLRKFDRVFDKFMHEPFDRIMNLDTDTVRHRLDAKVMEILGLEDVRLDKLRQLLAREPSLVMQ